MNREFDFHEYGESLARSLFADRVILSLARYQRIGTLDSPGEEALRRGKRFLTDIADVVGSQDNLAREQSMALVRVFEEAISAITTPLHSKTDFQKYIAQLRGTMDTILGGHKPHTEEIANVDKFFSNYGARQFRRAQEFASSSLK